MSKWIIIGGIVVTALLVMLLVAVKGGNRESSAKRPQTKDNGVPQTPAADRPGGQSATLTPGGNGRERANRFGLRDKYKNEIEDRAGNNQSTVLAQDPEAAEAAMKMRQKVGPALQTSARAYRSGQYATALEEAENILAHSPKTRRARVLATLSACALGRADQAIEHAKRLDSAGVLRAAEACEEHGIDLPEDIVRNAQVHKPRFENNHRE